MSFLAPLFLVGAAAISLPVLFHLIRRTTRERTPFSSLLFLKPSPPRVTRRSRLEHVLLLLLRCAALCLLAFGFSRPFLRQAINPVPPPASARRLAILVDVSASMQRAGLWDAARSRVSELLRSTSPADQVALFTFSRKLSTVLTFDQWKRTPVGERAALARSQLDTLRPGWSATHLGDALIATAEALADDGEPPFSGRQEMVVLTDLQEGSRIEPIQGYEWPKNLRVVIEPVRPRIPGNAGVQVVSDPNGMLASTSAVVRVRVTNASDSKKEQFAVGWGESGNAAFLGSPLEVYVPPGQSRIVSVPPPPAGHPDRIFLRGDDEPFDDTVYVFPPETVHVPVLYLGTDTGEDARQPLFFLRRALPATKALAIDVVVQPPSEPPGPAVVKAASLLVITEALPDASIGVLRQAILEGKTALVAPRSASDVSTLARLAGIASLPAEDVRLPGYGMFGELDFRHPLLATFADPRFSDFTRIHVWRYRRLDASALPDARVIARLDNRDPLWIDVPVGRGHLVVFTSGWHPDDSQLALSTKFVPLLFSMIEAGGPSLRAGGSQSVVDDPVPLPVPATEPLSLRAPDGAVSTLPAGTATFQGSTPGLYELSPGGGNAAVRRFAVNLDPSESLTSPRDTDELARLGAPVAEPRTEPTRPSARAAQLAAEAESQQKLWRWFILATILVLLGETALAAWTLRHHPTLEGATT